jgi:3-oxoacyl-[acyl-carrier protein] reductase
MDLGLEGKTAIVTGGGGGFGRIISEEFSAEGAIVIICSRKLEHLLPVKEKIEKNGGEAMAITVDISKKESIDNVVKKVLEKYGKIDILVNNASILSLAPLEEIDIQEWDKLMNINLRGSFLFSQAVIPHMIKRKSGAIISMSGIAALDGGVVGPHYSISKAGIICMTKCFAKYSGKHNVRVNTVCPGPIETEMTVDWPEDIVKTRLAMTPMGKFGRPEDVAAAVLYLSSDRAAHITGENIIIDGGITMD